MRGLIKRFQTFTLLPDWVLVQEAKLGEKEAFGKLYEKYLDRLYRYIFYRMRQNAEVTEDLTQTVFLKAWEKLASFKKGSFQAWLYTIARNTLIDYIRLNKQHAQLTENVLDEKENIEEKIQTKIDAEGIMDAAKFLTEDQQEIIVLKFVNELSYKEISEIMGKNEDALRALQYRAIKELKRRMSYDR